MCEPSYWIWLQRAVKPGTDVNAAVDYFGNAKEIYNAGMSEWVLSGMFTKTVAERMLATRLDSAYPVIDECKRNSWQIITPDSSEYPEALSSIYARPLVLYIDGDAGVLRSCVKIAFVGTREATAYGKAVAEKLSFAVAKAGAVIVSGAALGIDSIAHMGALTAGRRTIAVLGCGFGVNYLSENRGLREAISRNGALVTEYPPGTQATRYTFPARNRIISGLSQGTVVIEAGERSGSLITARLANEQGRDVFAVPGSIIGSSFTGANRLIRDGARPVFAPEDILGDYADRYPDVIDMSVLKTELAQRTDFSLPKQDKAKKSVKSSKSSKPSKPVAEQRPLPDDLSPEARAIAAVLSCEPQSVDELALESGLPVYSVLTAITELELCEAAFMVSGKRYVSQI